MSEEMLLWVALVIILAIVILPPALSEDIFDSHPIWGIISFALFYIMPFYLIYKEITKLGIIQLVVHILILYFGWEIFPISTITISLLGAFWGLIVAIWDVAGIFLLKIILCLFDISSLLLRIFFILIFLYFGYNIISWISQTSQTFLEFKKQILPQVLELISSMLIKLKSM